MLGEVDGDLLVKYATIHLPVIFVALVDLEN